MEGGESLLPALDAIVERGSELGVKEFIIGMAHRGRLNTLAHILNKPYTDIFEEFAGKAYDHGEDFDGDVKYHMGYSTDIASRYGGTRAHHIGAQPLAPRGGGPGGGRHSPGADRARATKTEDAVVPILVHGDAAVAGQGVVYEVVQMAELDGYRCGGHHPPGGQQPGRLYHQLPRRPDQHLLHGCGQGDALPGTSTSTPTMPKRW